MNTKKIKPFAQHTVKSLLAYTAVACAINLLVFAIINQLNFVHFSMNDDFFIQNLLNGSMGGYYQHFAHTSIALSKALSGLYALNWQVNWYGLYLFVALVLSTGMIGGVLMDKFGWKLGLALYALTLPLCCGLIFTNFTFTLVCYAMLGCALVCLVYGFYTKDKRARRFLYIVSVVALVSAINLRREVTASALVYCGAVAILLLIKHKRKALGVLLALVVGFGIAGGLTLADKAYFQNDAELAQFSRFHNARVDLMDHQPLNYALYPQVFADVGWSQNDVTTFHNFFTYPDDAQFSEENMEYIYEQMQPTRYNTNVREILGNVAQVFSTQHLYLLVCLFGLLAAALASQKRGLFRAFLIVMAVLPFLFHALFNVLWRDAMRAWYPHYMLSILVMLVFIDGGRLAKKVQARKTPQPKHLLAGALAAVVAVAGVGIGTMFYGTAQARTKMDTELEELFSSSTDGIRLAFHTMHTAEESGFMYPITSVLLRGNEAYGIFHAFPPGYFQNNRLLGGWDTRSPSYNDFKERYGLETLPRDLIDSDVLVVAPSLGFLQEYYMAAYGIVVETDLAMELAPNIIAVNIRSIQ